MDLLDNAIQSLQVGVEDYCVGSSPRLLSATRKHAGIVLRFKEALYRLSSPDSNDALIMSNIVTTKDPNRKIVFVRRSKSTLELLQERFKTLREDQQGTSPIVRRGPMRCAEIEI
jgi:hypothetical protein